MKNEKMKVRLLRKVRRAAWYVCADKLLGWTITNGIITGIRFVKGYNWAFEWMIRERLDPERDEDDMKIVFKVARLLWRRELRGKWSKRVRT